MKLNSRLLISILVLDIVIAAACSPTSLLRYGNRASCVGYLSSGAILSDVPGYPVPVEAEYAGLDALWHEASNAFVLNDANAVLHIINRVGIVENEIDNTTLFRSGGRLALSEHHNLAALAVEVEGPDAVYVYPFRKETLEAPKLPIAIEKTQSPAWHPNDPLLAGIYYPERDEYGSNMIAVFDLAHSISDPVDIYELKNLDIGAILGWSNNGQIIAASQYDRNGLIPYYIFLESGAVEKSLYHEANYNCVREAQWSPSKQIIAFPGRNTVTEGWDIFVEAIASPGGDNGSLINVTNTPQEDESDVSWSPDGGQIAYIKGYQDATGRLQQELFVMSLSDSSSSPVQLTDTPDEFETTPMWISDSEIAYLSWSPAELVWSLNSLSVNDTAYGPQRIMEIPQSWYREPGLEN